MPARLLDLCWRGERRFASMLDERCSTCQERMAYAKGDLIDLCGTPVTIVGVPALLCQSCGNWSISGNVRERLVVILATALEHARRHCLETLEWSFTPRGPAEIGGVPADLRDLFARLSALSRHERDIVLSLRRPGDGDPPRWFH